MAELKFSSVCPDSTEIIVVRHGETVWNADGRQQGHLDVELNELGKQQAVKVAERLAKEYKISAVYSSDLKRAFDTAKVIAAKYGGGIKVIKDVDLRERHLGVLQGQVLSKAAQNSPEAYEAYSSHSTSQTIPGGGESLDQVYQRCTSSLQKIARKHRGERVVVVAHKGVVMALHRRASPSGKSGGDVVNTSINILQLSIDEDSDEDEWTIKVWGDVSHLDETGDLKTGFGGGIYYSF